MPEIPGGFDYDSYFLSPVVGRDVEAISRVSSGGPDYDSDSDFDFLSPLFQESEVISRVSSEKLIPKDVEAMADYTDGSVSVRDYPQGTSVIETQFPFGFDTSLPDSVTLGQKLPEWVPLDDDDRTSLRGTADGGNEGMVERKVDEVIGIHTGTQPSRRENVEEIRDEEMVDYIEHYSIFASLESDGDEIQETSPGTLNAEKHQVNCKLPEIGMVFSSEAIAYEFYKNYSTNIGFCVRKGKVRRLANGKVRKKYFFCSRQGFRSKKQSNKTTKYRRKETRIGCKAMIQFTIENGEWMVSDLNLQHNHELVSSSQMCKSCRNISDSHENLDSVNEAGMEKDAADAKNEEFFVPCTRYPIATPSFIESWETVRAEEDVNSLASALTVGQSKSRGQRLLSQSRPKHSHIDTTEIVISDEEEEEEKEEAPQLIQRKGIKIQELSSSLTLQPISSPHPGKGNEKLYPDLFPEQRTKALNSPSQLSKQTTAIHESKSPITAIQEDLLRKEKKRKRKEEKKREKQLKKDKKRIEELEEMVAFYEAKAEKKKEKRLKKKQKQDDEDFAALRATAIFVENLGIPSKEEIQIAAVIQIPEDEPVDSVPKFLTYETTEKMKEYELVTSIPPDTHPDSFKTPTSVSFNSLSPEFDETLQLVEMATSAIQSPGDESLGTLTAPPYSIKAKLLFQKCSSISLEDLNQPELRSEILAQCHDLLQDLKNATPGSPTNLKYLATHMVSLIHQQVKIRAELFQCNETLEEMHTISDILRTNLDSQNNVKQTLQQINAKIQALQMELLGLQSEQASNQEKLLTLKNEALPVKEKLKFHLDNNSQLAKKKKGLLQYLDSSNADWECFKKSLQFF